MAGGQVTVDPAAGWSSTGHSSLPHPRGPPAAGGEAEPALRGAALPWVDSAVARMGPGRLTWHPPLLAGIRSFQPPASPGLRGCPCTPFLDCVSQGECSGLGGASSSLLLPS